MGERRLPPETGNATPRSKPIEQRKLALMHHDSDEDRIDAAERRAARNPREAGEAYAAIASDPAVGDEVRLSAAEYLANLTQQA